MDSKSIYNHLCNTHKHLVEVYGPGSGLHKHHIIPVHSGGTDHQDNYTYLTPRQHVIAHYLLWRIYRNPNDLRSMYMLGAELSVQQRRIVGEWCRDNNIGFYNEKWDDMKPEWRQKGLETQKASGDTNSFYWWSTPEGRKKRASMGGKASMESGNNKEWLYWSSPEGRKKRASMGGKANKGMRCVTNGKQRKRVRPEKLQEYLDAGYQLGFTLFDT